MWKICNLFKTVRSSNSFCSGTWPKAKAVCGPDKNQEDDNKDLKTNSGPQKLIILESLDNYSKFCSPINNRSASAQLKSGSTKSFSSLPSIAFINDDVIIQRTKAQVQNQDEDLLPQTSIKSKVQKKVQFDLGETLPFNDNNQPKIEIATQTENSFASTQNHGSSSTKAAQNKNIDLFPNNKSEDLENDVTKSAHNLIGSFKNMIGLDLAKHQLYTEAYEQFKHAAYVNEHPSAMYNLGICFYKGFGVKRDLNRAMEMWKKAADLGHNLAKYQVAVGHIRGLGQLTQNEKFAMDYLGSIGQDYSQEACTLYGALLYKNGDYKNAGVYLKKVHENSSPLASKLLAKISEIS